ncbi:MAG: hypothetical protein VZR04_10250, partial [Succiniclasticum sp.]|nr:hypothetical protein [Succiniclasticum sp.]
GRENFSEPFIVDFCLSLLLIALKILPRKNISALHISGTQIHYGCGQVSLPAMNGLVGTSTKL